jgi:hypothetical protein
MSCVIGAVNSVRFVVALKSLPCLKGGGPSKTVEGYKLMLTNKTSTRGISPGLTGGYPLPY